MAEIDNSPVVKNISNLTSRPSTSDAVLNKTNCTGFCIQGECVYEYEGTSNILNFILV